jgi:hypothetical protein
MAARFTTPKSSLVLRMPRYYAWIDRVAQRKNALRCTAPACRADRTLNGNSVQVRLHMSDAGIHDSRGRLLVRIGKVTAVRRPLQSLVCSGRLTIRDHEPTRRAGTLQRAATGAAIDDLARLCAYLSRCSTQSPQSNMRNANPPMLPDPDSCWICTLGENSESARGPDVALHTVPPGRITRLRPALRGDSRGWSATVRGPGAMSLAQGRVGPGATSRAQGRVAPR